MASYKIFVDHLTPEDDLVTEKQKRFTILKDEIKRIHDGQEATLEELDESFQKSLEELKSIREQVESGEDEEIKEAQTKYETLKTHFDTHWTWRAKDTQRAITNWERWKKGFKWYTIGILAANIICWIVWKLLYCFIDDYLYYLDFYTHYINSL